MSWAKGCLPIILDRELACFKLGVTKCCGFRYVFELLMLLLMARMSMLEALAMIALMAARLVIVNGNGDNDVAAVCLSAQKLMM